MYRKRNKAGRYVGNWLCKLEGEELNLGTKDAELARRHLAEAVAKGRRDFVDEIDEAAAALPDVAAAAPDPAPPAAPAAPAAAPPASPATSAAPAAASPASPAALPPVPPVDPQDFADTAAAAGEAAGAGPDVAGASPGGPEAPPAGVGPDVLDGFLRQGAQLAVDIQLGLQGALIRRYTGRKAGAIPPDAAVRGAAAEAWVAQLKIWFPADTMLPPWAMAIILPAMAIPVQVATSTEIPDDEKTPDEARAA
ncbi:MAG TPA: hypothetical protein VFJ64_10785 [Solirubrobacterales bacterium]|nr:hypothetical protein [Solirubrobacterales bacterium]